MAVHDGAAVAEVFTGEQKLQNITFLVLNRIELYAYAAEI
jgi:hypothetical protein